MGQASSSSASTAAINSTGGLVVNQPTPIMTWLVIGAVLLLAIYLWRKH